MTSSPSAQLPSDVVTRVSRRRKRTASASWKGSFIVVEVPAHLSEPEQVQVATKLAARLRDTSDDLGPRAHRVSERHLEGLAQAREVKWVENQSTRWASCTPATGVIRVSHRLRRAPAWVLDAVLLHELAHLLVPDHGPAFRALVARDPDYDRAQVFLQGYALGLDSATGPAQRSVTERGPASGTR